MPEAGSGATHAVDDGVLQVRFPDARWLSTGWRGGTSSGDVAYNVRVPEEWDCADLDGYVEERLAGAGFAASGPALLTGVELRHCRVARSGSVSVYATAGVSNPAALPMDPAGEAADLEAPADPTDGEDHGSPGTVNLLVTTDRSLDDAARANLLAVAVEAKAATLLHEVGVPGTTTDAVVVGSDPDGEPSPFSGSYTPVGADTRAAVREAVRASLAARYDEAELPGSVAAAEYGVRTERVAEVSGVVDVGAGE